MSEEGGESAPLNPSVPQNRAQRRRTYSDRFIDYFLKLSDQTGKQTVGPL